MTTCEAYCRKHKTWCMIDHEAGTLLCPHGCPHPAPAYIAKEVKKRRFHGHTIVARGVVQDTCCWRQKV